MTLTRESAAIPSIALNDDNTIPVLGLGVADLSEDETERAVSAALEIGCRLIDTAAAYGNEAAVGRAIAASGIPRAEVFVTSKLATADQGFSKAPQACIASLERLGLDYVDLYQTHRFDPLTPIEETMDALHDVVKSGKARYIGASSMFAWQFAKAQYVAETPFVSMQNHYNLVYREEEREMIPQCLDQGVGLIPWSPLARGLLAGNRTREGERLTTRARTDPFGDSLYTPEVDFAVVDRVAEVGRERGVSPAQVALAWLLHKPGVTAPIVGATKAEHLEDALAAEQLALSEDEISRLEEPYVPHTVSGIAI
jgi:aryl-alcohol dehydrogenase-like predicted oxidoreductase